MKRKDNKGRILPDGISQRPDGRYQGRITVDGKQYTVSGKELSVVKERFNELKVDINKGLVSENSRDNAKSDITLDEWWAVYLAKYKEGILKEIVISNYKRYWQWYVSPVIGSKKLTKITRPDLTKLVKMYEDREKPLAHGTIIYVHGLIKGCLQKAYLEDRIKKNPCYDVTSVLKNRTSKGKEIISVEQKELFMKYVHETNYARVYENLFEVLFGTGVRIGECICLTWDSIDFEKNIIRIDKTLHYKNLKGAEEEANTHFFITEPKTVSAYREIPMSSKVKEALLRQQQYQKTFKLSSEVVIDGYKDFVFTNSNRNTYNADYINAVIKRIVKGCNKMEKANAEKEEREALIIKEFSPHSTRHYFASRCVEQGMMPKALQNILGHKKIETTLSIYTHLSQNTMQDEINKIKI